MLDYFTSASFAVLPISTFELVDVAAHEISFNSGSADYHGNILSESIATKHGNILSESLIGGKHGNILSESLTAGKHGNILSESIVANILSES
jgi:hypothetical protein